MGVADSLIGSLGQTHELFLKCHGWYVTVCNDTRNQFNISLSIPRAVKNGIMQSRRDVGQICRKHHPTKVHGPTDLQRVSTMMQHIDYPVQLQCKEATGKIEEF